MKLFSERLDQLLTERGRGAAAELAQVCDVDRGYISKLQHGSASNPSEHLLRCMANFFGVNVAWLRDGEAPRLKRMQVDDDDSGQLRDGGVRYGSPKKPAAVQPLNALAEDALLDIIEIGPSQIALQSEPLVRDALVRDVEAAARELRKRIKLRS